MSKTIGILGAGQLARMLALAGYPLGLNFIFFDSTPAPCAASLGRYYQGQFDDWDKLKEFAAEVDIITLENENIPLETLQALQELKPVYPGARALEVSQDRAKEKQFCREHNIKTTDFCIIASEQDLIDLPKQLAFPFVIKTCRNGYDGKGQFWCQSQTDLENLSLNFKGGQRYIAESKVAFNKELSIIAAKSITGEVKFYDVCENSHLDGILRQTRNHVSHELLPQGKQIVTKVLASLEYVGVLAVEFFVVGDSLWVNEFAPRVHNSGHWTIEGAKTSQFENHLRAILGWPLGETDSIGIATMTNFIGEMLPAPSLLQHDDIHLHDYGKTPRPGRKIGHMTKMVRTNAS